ncbi:hypothetical protein PRUPE_1G170400 [Prunus persica]|uniref:Retrotransposon Copia-like N-terminal domain-containing protein n=1 Tax=Prunus persica TaxID=3760 RepID=M5X966_PRUPE|nr:hypothetical protein PRUPE_1G170400 [Prunus persica]
MTNPTSNTDGDNPSPAPTVLPSPIVTSMPVVINIKLDRSNYPLWLPQIVPILRSQNLMEFDDGTCVCPSPTLTGGTAAKTAYSTWIQQDQLILSWINSSLTPSVLSTLSRNQNAHTSWQALESRYASTSQNRILHLRNEIFRTMKVQTHDTPITYDTLEALLLTAKRQMVEQVVPMPKNGPSAFVATCGHGGFHPRNFGRGAVLPTREGFPNQRGGSSRGTLSTQHTTNFGESSASATPRIVC